MRPVASLVIPAFNASAYLHAAMQSALTQTLAELEVVLVDDGSDDATRSIAQSYAAKDSRVTVLAHPVPQGPSAARNTAIAAAQGAWIVLLDADDTMEAFRVERLVAEAQARGLDALADNLELIDATSEQRMGAALDPRLMTRRELLSLEDLLAADWPGHNPAYRNLGVAKPILRRAFLVDQGLSYDPEVRLGEDLLFYSALLLRGGRFGVTPAASYLYRTNGGSTSQRKAPTTELVEVNQKVRALARASGRGSDVALRALLDHREAALRLQVLTWSVKTGAFSLAGRMAREIGVARLLRLSWERLWDGQRAPRRATSDAVMTPDPRQMLMPASSKAGPET